MLLQPTQRLTSLDAFRGIIIAGMILVTDPGTYSAVYSQLLHAPWDGVTATDMIFPSFLFMVGFSITLSFGARLGRGEDKSKVGRHILYRTLMLFVLGLAINGFPAYHLATIRIAGILQRIALCYLFCGLFFLYLSAEGQAAQGHVSARLFKTGVAVVLLLGSYWILLTLVPVPGIGAGHLDSYGNLPAYIDRKVIGIDHLWIWGSTPGRGVTYDPEGLLSTLPALGSTLIGVMAGQWWLAAPLSPERKALRLGVAGAGLIIGGLLLSHYLSINKRIWTTSFALLSSGVALVLFALLIFIVDVKGFRRWARSFLILGSNAILAFVISSILTSLADIIHVSGSGERLSLHEYGNKLSLLTGLSPLNASLLYALFVVVINVLILLPLYRKKVHVKI